ncbi:hypothetical protein SISSUDRAFT_670586 [Sistotremastrum suecicum HHB10207 ss-3]|uniref:Uncharacterized protein n=1 Tax=Sistotremastrum suecicum HHB10207 ss-3 TaxID=1314776 RepID=A0A166E1D7_9AGAM|nr:hypothetical protein SISSUDRAFT_670586 [Sistotremastrum suecicum HHB10207 ss-3]
MHPTYGKLATLEAASRLWRRRREISSGTTRKERWVWRRPNILRRWTSLETNR